SYFNVVRKTIYAWFTLWESGGVEAILHKTGTGCKKKLKDVAVGLLKQKVEDHSRNLKPVLSWLIHTYQVKVSKKTLQRFLKIQRLDLA
ncbi:MAG: helix-turn-helix domain-containing protein, partial [Verrucomicrobia bacterium]|nr:helix-turn-helix domain-containing protein [Cytophagales bacterium]